MENNKNLKKGEVESQKFKETFGTEQIRQNPENKHNPLNSVAEELIVKKRTEHSHEQLVEKRKEKIKNWLKNKYNLYFLGIIILTFIIRLYYFILTKNQTLWWDEAEYMSIAKVFSFKIPFEISPQRLVLFPFLAFILYKLGLAELSIKFFLVLIPSLLVVFFTYKFVREMYNEKIALLTALITSICWIHIFYTARVMNDEIGFLFGLIALYFFWKGYVDKKGNKYVYLSAFFIALSFLIRPIGIYYAAIIFFFLFITEQFKFLKKPQLWAMLLIFLLTITPHLIWSYYYHGNFLAFGTAYGAGGEAKDIFSINGWALRFIYDYSELIFFVFFLIGIWTLLSMFIGFDKLVKGNKKYYNDLFMLISILFVVLFSIIMFRAGENRWLIAMSLGIFVFSAKGIFLIFDFVRKNFGKIIAIIIFILIILSGAYMQLKHADIIIKDKLHSYEQVKEASLWIKEHSEPGDVIFSRSWPQTTYYSERETFTFDAYLTTAENETDFINLLKEKKPKYFVLSIFEPKGEWMFALPQKYPGAFTSVQAYIASINGQEQPLLIIYEFNSDKI